MKTIRRMTALTLALFTLFTAAMLTACAPKDATSIFAQAAEKTGGLEYIHAEADLRIKVGYSGLSMELPLEAELRADNTDGDNLIYHMHTKMTVPMIGISLEFDLYSADGYMYVDIMDEKLRTPAASTLEDPDALAEVEAELNAILEESLAEAEVHETNGGKRFTIDLPPERVLEASSKLSEESDDAEEAEMTAERMKITFTVNKEGYIEQLELDMVFIISEFDTDGSLLDNSTTEFTLSGSITFTDIGEELTVELPDDLDSYEDMEDAPSLSDALGGIAM